VVDIQYSQPYSVDGSSDSAFHSQYSSNLFLVLVNAVKVVLLTCLSCVHVQAGLPSVLCRCSLGGRKGIRPVKTEWWVAGLVICLERGADLHMAKLMPLPVTVSCFSKI